MRINNCLDRKKLKFIFFPLKARFHNGKETTYRRSASRRNKSCCCRKSSQTHDFDFESNEKTQITGNIYLAKVTRVEPSLQAAFLDYGGNRHGFLAFSEIHPDYYQIPLADKEALIAEQLKAEESAQKKELEAITNEDRDHLGDEVNSLEGSLISALEMI